VAIAVVSAVSDGDGCVVRRPDQTRVVDAIVNDHLDDLREFARRIADAFDVR
jgi:hypothetical protein